MLRLCTNLKSKLTVPMVCGTASYDAHQPHLARTKSAQRPRFCPLLIPRLRAPAPSRPHRHTAVPLGSRRRQRLDALRPWPRCWHCWRHHRALRRPPKRPPTGTLICRPRTATMPVAAESGDLCSLIPPPPPPLSRRSLALRPRLTRSVPCAVCLRSRPHAAPAMCPRGPIVGTRRPPGGRYSRQRAVHACVGRREWRRRARQRRWGAWGA